MELLEADFAQIEHVNQIIYDNLHHVSWSCFDTHHLIKAHKDMLSRLYTNQATIEEKMIGTYDSSNPKNSRITKNITDVRYDSFLVSVTQLDGGVRYDFEIRNALWDGSYKVTKSKNSSDEADVNFDASNVIITRNNKNENNISFTITDNDADSVRICFKMNVQADGRNIQTTSFVIKNPTEYTHQFDKEVCEKGQIVSEHGTAMASVKVTIEPVDSIGRPIVDGIKSNYAITDANGYFTMCYGAVATPGDYYVLMKIDDSSSSATTSQIIHIKKVQNQTIFIDWGDTSQYSNVPKGSIKVYEIKIGLYDEYGVHSGDLDSKLAGLNINATWIGFGDDRHTQTCKITTNSRGEYVINPTCSYRNYYFDTSRLEIEIPISDYGSKTAQRVVRHTWCVANTYNDLYTYCTDSYGADWIFLKPQSYTRTKSITISREITIAGLSGSSACEINGNKGNIFIISNQDAGEDNHMKVNLVGITLKNAECAVRLDTGCRLLVNRCYFTQNAHTQNHHRGCSIYMPVTDKTVKINKNWRMEVKNSYFYNNKGNEIQSIGTTNINHSLFKTDTASCLQQPEVKVVSVRAGEVTYSYNKSYIRIPFTNKNDAMGSNHSYAKALTYVGTGSKFNGKGPKQLKGNLTLPLYGKPYYNEAYTYCCYYYPYDNVKTHIVCSPKVGFERKATGHSSSVENWVYYDGYQFNRLSAGKGNKRNPWTSDELAIPANLGIYDLEKDKFISNYDPRFKDNLAKTSDVDVL